ncbi:MAG: carboxypeptidase regulatory-like domain-containing protein [Bacteroidota bacterium]
MRKYLLLVMVSLFTTVTALAQVTTSSMTGTVKDSKETLIGATVTAVHEPTGTRYAVTTNADGRFNIANMRVGGPYTVTISYVGYQTTTLSDISIRLGEPFAINQTLAQSGVTLNEVAIRGRKDAVMNSRRTGASTNIGRTQLENMPTSGRSLTDFLRLAPQASTTPAGGTSFGGTSSKFNSVTIDGAVNNDVFGLSANGTPGGGAGTQPISLDAIQEVQVVLAPYDVTLGNFTGAGVNAVTRSGTNKFEGSVYYFTKNQDLAGKNVLTTLKQPNFSDKQYGVRLGGPIIQNKLFFFTSIELGRRTAPIANNAGEPGAAISLATAQQIAARAQSVYGYDVGSYTAQNLSRNNDKIFVKLDWNIDAKNQLTARYNYIDAFDDNLTRSGTFFNFGNNGYKFANKQNVGIIELRTNFNSKYSNNFLAGYTRIRDARQTQGTLFPSVQINNIDGISGNSAVFGSERSSVANQLDQDIIEVTDNFKINLGEHLLTFGTHNEFFKFRNLFINNLNGRWTFNNMADFMSGANGANAQVAATYSRVPGDATPAAKFSAAQLSVYGQDEWEAAKGLKLTFGVRFDKPVFGDKPLANPTIEASFPGYRTDRTPSTAILISPRLGFNFDPIGDRTIQLRGGTGIFTGRVPFVWMSNQYGASGMLFSTVSVNNPPGAQFIPNPNNQAAAGAGSTRAEVNLVSENFKIPQVWRTNLAGDFKLPYGIVATVEGIYSKTLNNVVYRDINMTPSTGTLNPVLSGGVAPGSGADNRPIYPGRVNNTAFTNVILLENSNKGYTYTLTGQLQKTFDNGFNTMFAYTYGRAKSVNDGTSSTALSNWEFVQISQDPNNPPLATSTFETRHRLVGSAGYQFTYGPQKSFGTGFSLFYQGFSGLPYTYLVNGNLNSDAGVTASGNDLFYVPRNSSEIKFNALSASGALPAQTAAQQWDALNAYIENDPYLRTRRGQYAERNGARTPWEHKFDLRITQDLGGMIGETKNRLQLSLDVFNVGNLLNKSWGRQYNISNQAYALVGVSNPTNAVTGGYTFRAPSTNTAYTAAPTASAWSMQFGVRYLFN